MLIRCNGNVLVPLSRIDKCEDRGDTIVVYVNDERHYASGVDAEVIRSLIAPQVQPKAAKEQAHGKQEGIAAIPVFPQGGKRNGASR